MALNINLHHPAVAFLQCLLINILVRYQKMIWLPALVPANGRKTKLVSLWQIVANMP